MRKLALFVAVLVLLALPVPGFSGGMGHGPHGGWHGGWHGGGWRGWRPVPRFGVYVGVPWVGPAYPYPLYPAPYVSPPGVAPGAGACWSYCPGLQAYYPSVGFCAGGWVPVAPW